MANLALNLVKTNVCQQRRNEVGGWRPGQEASLAPSCSNLRSFGSKCTVLKKVLGDIVGTYRRPGHCAPLVTPPFVSL